MSKYMPERMPESICHIYSQMVCQKHSETICQNSVSGWGSLEESNWMCFEYRVDQRMLLIHLIAIKSLSLWPAVTVHSAEAYTCLYWSYPRDMGKLYASLSALLGWDRSSCLDFVAVHAGVVWLNLLATSNQIGPGGNMCWPILQQLSVALLTSLALASWRQRVVQAVVRVRFFPRIDLFCKDAGCCLAFSEAWFLLVDVVDEWRSAGNCWFWFIVYMSMIYNDIYIYIYILNYNSYNYILIYLTHQEPTDL